jgi:hypothetical protein
MSLHRAAAIISTLGNPLLTFPVCVALVSFRSFEVEKASFISLVAIVGVILPVSIRNYVKTRRGEYTNFDVSDQEQRKGFYLLPVILISIALLVFYFTNQPSYVLAGTLLSLLLMITGGLINLKIKCSLHAAASIFLSFLLLRIWFYTGVVMFVFTILICISRFILKRHSVIEIITGLMVGSVFGSPLKERGTKYEERMRYEVRGYEVRVGEQPNADLRTRINGVRSAIKGEAQSGVPFNYMRKNSGRFSSCKKIFFFPGL